MLKTVNLAYKESLGEKTKPVITVRTNPGLRMRSRFRQQETVTLQPKPVYEVFKRGMDIACSAAALVVLSPLLAAASLSIVATDLGSPIYTQTRVGKDGKPFRIYKFRSMYLDADERKAALMAQNESQGATFKMKDDPRITKVGAFLRKTSIDELPQLVNILKGDMTIVGPRPFIPDEQDKLPEDRLLVKPGLSCYWQIGGGNDLPLEEQIALDRRYIKERSMWTDIKIIFRTVAHVLGGKNC